MAPLPCKDCCRRGLKCYLHCCWSQLLPPFIVAVHVFDTYTCTSLVVLLFMVGVLLNIAHQGGGKPRLRRT